MATSVTGIPTSRITASFIRSRLLSQVQSSLLSMADLELQLSTGVKFQVASADPTTASQVMTLQQLIAKQTQIKTNITTNSSYLAATDSALMSASKLITSIRSAALGAIGDTVTDSQRSSVAEEVQQALEQLLSIGNTQFRDRYLFAGSDCASSPFSISSSNLVTYSGNTTSLLSYDDVSSLFSTNVDGNAAFGSISTEVKGTASLSPTLTSETKLTDLRGGEGLDLASILVSDGTKTSTIDLSGAKTIGDVAELIKAHAPAGRELNVEINAKSISISLDKAGGGTLSISDVGSGTTAAELGIVCQNVGVNTVTGRDLDPIVEKTASTSSLLGSQARAVLFSKGADNDVVFTADTMGATTSAGVALNGVAISYVADSATGAVSVNYTPGSSIVIHVATDGSTTADQVIAAVNTLHSSGGIPFSAKIDPLDNVNGGKGIVEYTSTATTHDGYGSALDQTHGLQITNENKTVTVDISSAKTLEDIMNAITGSGVGVTATINDTGTGINVTSQVSGCDFMIGENGGTTATQLGIRTFTSGTALSELNYGEGVSTSTNATGRKATVTLVSGLPNTNIRISSIANGSAYNDYKVSFVNSGLPNSATVDTTNKTITVCIGEGVTTANDVVKTLNNDSTFSSMFNATLANNDDSSTNTGTGLITASTTGTTAEGSDGGTDFTITRSDGVKLYVNIGDAKTVQDVIDSINNNTANIPSPTGGTLTARLAEFGNGIELLDASDGTGTLLVTADSSSNAAVDLGLISKGKTTSSNGIHNAAVTMDCTAYDSGVIVSGVNPVINLKGISVVYSATASGVVYSETNKTLTVGITPGVTTANDVVSMINTSSVASLFSASLDPNDFDPATETFNSGNGFVNETSGTMVESTTGSQVITGADVNQQETKGLYTALSRLQAALLTNDEDGISRAIAILDSATTSMEFTQAELGTREQALDDMASQLSNNNIQVQTDLSNEYDADFVNVISDLTAKQVAYQAALKTIGTLSQMSLLDYL